MLAETYICTATVHSDMPTFVGFMLGIMACTSFWDKPRLAMQRFILAWHVKVKEKYSDELKLSCLPDYDKTQKTEWLTNNYIAIFGAFHEKISFGHRWIYFPLALICIAAGSFELFFSYVKEWGYYNSFLLIPPTVYLLYCIFLTLVGRFKQYQFFHKIRAYCEVKEQEKAESDSAPNSNIDQVKQIINLIHNCSLPPI